MRDGAGLSLLRRVATLCGSPAMACLRPPPVAARPGGALLLHRPELELTRALSGLCEARRQLLRPPAGCHRHGQGPAQGQGQGRGRERVQEHRQPAADVVWCGGLAAAPPAAPSPAAAPDQRADSTVREPQLQRWWDEHRVAARCVLTSRASPLHKLSSHTPTASRSPIPAPRGCCTTARRTPTGTCTSATRSTKARHSVSSTPQRLR